MNAKKIMGAVLVALLAAALFIGAGAAADNGTVFMYQKNVAANNGVWTNGEYTVTIDGGIVTSDNFVPGTYKKGDDTLYITYPTATYSANAKVNDIAYIIGNNGKAYTTIANFDLIVSSAAKLTPTKIQVTYPSGEVSTIDVTQFESKMNGGNVVAGTYKIQAIFADTDFVGGLNSDYLLDTFNSFTFTVVSEDDATISATVDTLFNGEYTFITIEGTIGKQYTLVLDGFDINTNQFTGVDNPITPGAAGEYSVKMPNSGKLTLQIKANSTEDEATVSLKGIKDAEIEFKISAPVVTATVGAASYFVGDIIKIAGTSTSDVTSTTFTFKIAGTNFKETDLASAKVTGDDTKFNGKEWKIAFNTADVKDADGKKLDVGTYTIKIYQGKDVVKTLAVVLKQPFISIVSAPEVVAQNTDAEFVINAEAAAGIKAYFFGTNYFAVADKIEQDADLKNQFTATLKDTTTDNMSTGQYFAVFQHPMYDGKFNINATAAGKFYLNTEATATGANGDTFLFAFNDRQTANAAQALCDALDSQNIDDMYVKYSFFVVGKDAAFTISEIPSEIAKGTTLTISGVDTANADKAVVVEMISTAFAAVPKDTVGSAAFIVVTTEVAEDGTWEVTLDTSDLNVDEYSLSVVINSVEKKNVQINVVEADEPVTPEQPEEPEQPEQPEEPVAPATPGFGALAALAGLGAVAVLLLRRE